MNRPTKTAAPDNGFRLTEAELRIMKVLWSLGQGTVHDVLQTVNAQSAAALAYTTVSTMLRILEQKGAARSERGKPAHIFHPVLSRAAYEASSVRELLQNVFENDASPMLCRLVESGAVDDADLKRLEELLLARRKGGGA